MLYEVITFKKVSNELIPITNKSIEALLSGDIQEMFSQLRKLSEFQLEHFQEMIPEMIHPLWKKGLQTSDYLLKLCGSGGGGYMLGFTRNFSKVKELFKKHQLEIIPVFKQS